MTLSIHRKKSRKKIMDRKSQNFIVNYEILEYNVLHNYFCFVFVFDVFFLLYLFGCLFWNVLFLFWYLFKILIENQIVSGFGCQVFHGISAFWVLDACITGSVIVWLPRNWIFILKCSAKASSVSCTWPFNTLPPLIGLPGSMFGIHVPLVTQLGTTSVAWYNLHFGLMIVKVNFFLLYKKWKKTYILLWIN